MKVTPQAASEPLARSHTAHACPRLAACRVPTALTPARASPRAMCPQRSRLPSLPRVLPFGQVTFTVPKSSTGATVELAPGAKQQTWEYDDATKTVRVRAAVIPTQ